MERNIKVHFNYDAWISKTNQIETVKSDQALQRYPSLTNKNFRNYTVKLRVSSLVHRDIWNL